MSVEVEDTGTREVHTFASGQTPQGVRDALGCVGLVFPKGVDTADKTQALPGRHAMRDGGYVFVRLQTARPPLPRVPPPRPEGQPPVPQQKPPPRMVPNQPPPPQQKPPLPEQPPPPRPERQQPPPPRPDHQHPPLPPRPPGKAAPPPPVPAPPSVVAAPPPQRPQVVSEVIKPVPVIPLPPRVVALPPAYTGVVLKEHLAVGHTGRVETYLARKHVLCEEATAFLDGTYEGDVSVDKARFVEDMSAAVVHFCDESKVRFVAGRDVTALDLWCVFANDMHSRGYVRTHREGATELWSHDTSAAPSLEGWGGVDLTLLLTDLPEADLSEDWKVNLDDETQATTVQCHPAVTTRFGGEDVFVFGRNMVSEIDIMFDWPYGGQDGWKRRCYTDFCNANTALLLAPSLLKSYDEDSARVFVLASHPDADRDRGSAFVTYALAGEAEVRLMYAGIARLLLVSLDYTAHPFAGVVHPTLSGKCLSSGVESIATKLTEASLLEYMTESEQKGRLKSLLECCDTAGRLLLHYACRLGWMDVFFRCLDGGGLSSLVWKQ